MQSDSAPLDPSFSSISLLRLTYVLLAAGVALTKHRYVMLTSRRIRHASRQMSSSEPELAASTLAICLTFASIGCAAVGLHSPPAILLSVDWHLGASAAVPIAWSGLMSLGVAGFGANAYAAADACYPSSTA